MYFILNINLIFSTYRYEYVCATRASCSVPVGPDFTQKVLKDGQ